MKNFITAHSKLRELQIRRLHAHLTLPFSRRACPSPFCSSGRNYNVNMYHQTIKQGNTSRPNKICQPYLFSWIRKASLHRTFARTQSGKESIEVSWRSAQGSQLLKIPPRRRHLSLRWGLLPRLRKENQRASP